MDDPDNPDNQTDAERRCREMIAEGNRQREEHCKAIGSARAAEDFAAHARQLLGAKHVDEMYAELHRLVVFPGPGGVARVDEAVLRLQCAQLVQLDRIADSLARLEARIG